MGEVIYKKEMRVKRIPPFARFFVRLSQIQYVERQRPEHRSEGLLIDAQVADAPRTVNHAPKLYWRLIEMSKITGSLAARSGDCTETKG